MQFAAFHGHVECPGTWGVSRLSRLRQVAQAARVAGR